MQHTKPQMQGCKLLKIEGTPTLAIFELRDSKYWDGIRVTRMDDGVTPMPNGFYVSEHCAGCTRDGRTCSSSRGIGFQPAAGAQSSPHGNLGNRSAATRPPRRTRRPT